LSAAERIRRRVVSNTRGSRRNARLTVIGVTSQAAAIAVNPTLRGGAFLIWQIFNIYHVKHKQKLRDP
jgi:hypothetical protein